MGSLGKVLGHERARGRGREGLNWVVAGLARGRDKDRTNSEIAAAKVAKGIGVVGCPEETAGTERTVVHGQVDSVKAEV